MVHYVTTSIVKRVCNLYALFSYLFTALNLGSFLENDFWTAAPHPPPSLQSILYMTIYKRPQQTISIHILSNKSQNLADNHLFCSHLTALITISSCFLYHGLGLVGNISGPSAAAWIG